MDKIISGKSSLRKGRLLTVITGLLLLTFMGVAQTTKTSIAVTWPTQKKPSNHYPGKQASGRGWINLNR